MKRLLPFLLTAVALTGCATAQQPATGKATDHPGSIPVLLGLDPVRQDLKLTSLQCALLDSLRSQYKSQVRNLTQLGMADEDASLRASWDLRSLRKQFNGRALAVLTPSQQDRLRQIERQMLGGNLLTSPAEQKLLGLDAGQQQQLAAIARSSQAQVNAINARYNAGQLSPFWRGIKLRGIQSKSSQQMVSVLTRQQKKQWLVLSGQKMGFPKVHDPNARTQSLFEGY